MNAIEFRSRWELRLFKWISKHWDEIECDEWILHSHILESLRKSVPSIEKSIYHHSCDYRSHQEHSHRVLNIDIKYLYEDGNWYQINFPIWLEKLNAYKYNAREGF